MFLELITDILPSIKYMILFSNFLIIIVIYIFNKKKNREISKVNSKKVLITIAHPDDESMFFIPTINYLKYCFYEIHILCLSNGNSKIREDELNKAGKYLNIDKIKIIDNKDLKDDINKYWDKKIIKNTISEYIKENKINALVTFDKKGVSNHKNHISIFNSLEELKKELENSFKIYVLKSLPIYKKFLGIFEIIFELKENWVLVNFNIITNIKSMYYHYSQFVWYRKLWIIFSSYNFINTLIEY